ncbi:MAG: DoxX family protein [Actinomycetes bacterium]
MLGGLGVVVGVWMPVLGLLAALFLTLYFLGAVFAHLRIKDPLKEVAPAIVLFVVALITTVLETTR